MEQSKPRNIKGTIVIVILILVLVGLGVLAWVYRDKLTGSASTLTSSTPAPNTSGAGCYVYRPAKDVSSQWRSNPIVPIGSQYININEVTANDSTYLWSNSQGSNDGTFAFSTSGPILPGANYATKVIVVVRAKLQSGSNGKLTLNTKLGSWQKSESLEHLTTSWANYTTTYTGSWHRRYATNLSPQLQMNAASGNVMVSQIWMAICK